MLKDEEVIVGVRLGIREQAMNSKGKKEDGPVSQIQFVIAKI